MAKRTRSTIQDRITGFMVLFTILLAGSFCATLLFAEVKTMTIHNQFRARLGGMIAKKSLEESLGDLQGAVQRLQESDIADEITVLTKDGKVAASTEASLFGKEELVYIKDAISGLSEKRWFYANVEKGVIDLFIPLESNVPYGEASLRSAPQYDYIAKMSFSLGNIKTALAQVYQPMVVTAIVIIFINILLGWFLSRTVIGPIKRLDEATDIIAGGNLEHKVKIKTDDELEDLAERFNHMGSELIRMKERAENANPLTKLPGNNVIHEEIEKRIKECAKFVVVYADLDNFKAFNDKYGIGAGDEAIKLTAKIMQESQPEFLGHEGGDDFVILTTPEKSEAVTNYILTEFDKKIRGLYSKEDLDKGFIISKARDGSIVQFPIMSISLAGVTNAYKPLTSYAEVTNICADVKKKAKAMPGSTFVLDKRL